MVKTYITYYDEVNKVWYGSQVPFLYSPNVTVGQVILNTLEINPNKIGQISDNNGLRLTNQELRTKTITAAQHLIEMGYQQGDLIAIISRNNHNVAPIIFAALTIGTPVNTLDATFKQDEIAHMLQHTNPKLIFCEMFNIITVREALQQLKMSVPIFTFDGKVDGARNVEDLFMKTGKESQFVPPEIEDGSKLPAAVLCSSGTTGLSKGVSLSHACLLSYVANLLEMTADDNVMCFSSLYWLSGFGTLISATMKQCTRIITTEPFSAELFLHIFEKYRVSVTLSAPSYMARVLHCAAIETTDLSHLKYYFCGGSAVADELVSGMNRHLPNGAVYVAYGATEVAGMVSLNFPHPKNGSVGQLNPNVKIKILDDSGNKCGCGMAGEVCIYQKYMFLEYCGAPEETKNAFDEDGWFKTGDVGYMTEDGYLQIIDRKKEILKYSNYQISPTEIEGLLRKHRGVDDVCVVGIPDIFKTDLPAAIVIKNDCVDVTENEINSVIKEKLADCKQLRGGVYFVDSIPMTPSGKVARSKAKNMAIELYNEKLRG